MFRITFLILACSLTLNIVECKKMAIPSSANHIDRQCSLAGYRSSCENLNWNMHGVLDCANVKCAGPIRRGSTMYRAMSIGRAADGTRCSTGKICYAGRCSVLPRGVNMPRQVGEKETLYECFEPHSG